ncbi:protein phosphatase 1 regulatory subunit 3C isoform X2 [Hermetia illucens]|uniref:protein phosphatase 1 regulatory subunit 3C isoform X2 n=1 Tax=Hermetia illucens TaxID=343691 RepID=UPI0018CC252A|nr:protein phosphatase 1 regulatory subunit 3C isoform X2 [Hermetia illucens]XP_037905152.1 protein phosphatase 1 regulatory subunit 3C isoform X2 [Hermetia illucens]XP_037905153.1 protein phosphatase 1 regulatory subunit 3C isoform X2 [Hermetia illucens]XP_037905154.1 protein phosphatase 1 regulatory subunit 3C isoform X2 [Hermetia illucens]
MSVGINMPAYYDMIVSHSPPASFLSDFSANNYSFYDPHPRSCRPQVLTPPQSRRVLSTLQNTKSVPEKVHIAPKSCLVNRPSDCACSEDTAKSPTRTKKRVIFADDQGRSLTEVRIMSEPSSVPPLWSLKFLAQITQGLVSPHPSEQWTIDFRQPASDYLQFRKRIDDLNVSLENVIVRENESIVVGTVKVKNLSFHKEVIVRATWDDWKSQQDIFCTYSQIYGSSAAYVLYDTFSFKITLPPSSKKLEFCICFRSDGKEYWDNNNDKNYTISKKSPSCQSHPSEILINYDSSDSSVKTSNLKYSSDQLTQGDKSNFNTWPDASWSQKAAPYLYKHNSKVIA